VGKVKIGIIFKGIEGWDTDVARMRFIEHLAIIYSNSRSKRKNAKKKLTLTPITASKSPTALTTISHMSRKAVFKNCWIGTC
jgi:hypothetical protein